MMSDEMEVGAPPQIEHASHSTTGPHLGGWLGKVGWLFPRHMVTETVTTAVLFDEPPEAVWRRILFYEEVPLGPPLLLRLFLPHPVRTEGDKTRVGAQVRCLYRGGHLVKRMTVIDSPRLVRFRVVEQQLGIEGCVTTLDGSYQIRTIGRSSEVVLTTNYRGHLRPRLLWRPFERFLAQQVHRYILLGMRAKLAMGERHAIK